MKITYLLITLYALSLIITRLKPQSGERSLKFLTSVEVEQSKMDELQLEEGPGIPWYMFGEEQEDAALEASVKESLERLKREKEKELEPEEVVREEEQLTTPDLELRRNFTTVRSILGQNVTIEKTRTGWSLVKQPENMSNNKAFRDFRTYIQESLRTDFFPHISKSMMSSLIDSYKSGNFLTLTDRSDLFNYLEANLSHYVRRYSVIQFVVMSIYFTKVSHFKQLGDEFKEEPMSRFPIKMLMSKISRGDRLNMYQLPSEILKAIIKESMSSWVVSPLPAISKLRETVMVVIKNPRVNKADARIITMIQDLMEKSAGNMMLDTESIPYYTKTLVDDLSHVITRLKSIKRGRKSTSLKTEKLIEKQFREALKDDSLEYKRTLYSDSDISSLTIDNQNLSTENLSEKAIEALRVFSETNVKTKTDLKLLCLKTLASGGFVKGEELEEIQKTIRNPRFLGQKKVKYSSGKIMPLRPDVRLLGIINLLKIKEEGAPSRSQSMLNIAESSMREKRLKLYEEDLSISSLKTKLTDTVISLMESLRLTEPDNSPFMKSLENLLTNVKDASANTASDLWSYATILKGNCGQRFLDKMLDSNYLSEYARPSLGRVLAHHGYPVAEAFKNYPSIYYLVPDGCKVTPFSSGHFMVQIYEVGWVTNKDVKKKNEREKWKETLDILKFRGDNASLDVITLSNSIDDWKYEASKYGKRLDPWMHQIVSTLHSVFDTFLSFDTGFIEGISELTAAQLRVSYKKSLYSTLDTEDLNVATERTLEVLKSEKKFPDQMINELRKLYCDSDHLNNRADKLLSEASESKILKLIEERNGIYEPEDTVKSTITKTSVTSMVDLVREWDKEDLESRMDISEEPNIDQVCQLPLPQLTSTESCLDCPEESNMICTDVIMRNAVVHRLFKMYTVPIHNMPSHVSQKNKRFLATLRMCNCLELGIKGFPLTINRFGKLKVNFTKSHTRLEVLDLCLSECRKIPGVDPELKKNLHYLVRKPRELSKAEKLMETDIEDLKESVKFSDQDNEDYRINRGQDSLNGHQLSLLTGLVKALFGDLIFETKDETSENDKSTLKNLMANLLEELKKLSSGKQRHSEEQERCFDILKVAFDTLDPLSFKDEDEKFQEITSRGEETLRRMSKKIGATFVPDPDRLKNCEWIVEEACGSMSRTINIGDLPTGLLSVDVVSSMLKDSSNLQKIALKDLISIITDCSKFRGFDFLAFAHLVGEAYTDILESNTEGGNFYLKQLGDSKYEMLIQLPSIRKSEETVAPCVIFSENASFIRTSCTGARSGRLGSSHKFYMNYRIARQYSTALVEFISYVSLYIQSEGLMTDNLMERRNCIKSMYRDCMWIILNNKRNVNILLQNTRYLTMAGIAKYADHKGLGKKMAIPIRTTFEYLIVKKLKEKAIEWGSFRTENSERISQCYTSIPDKNKLTWSFPSFFSGRKLTNPTTVILEFYFCHLFDKKLPSRNRALEQIVKKSIENQLKFLDMIETGDQGWRVCTGLDFELLFEKPSGMDPGDGSVEDSSSDRDSTSQGGEEISKVYTRLITEDEQPQLNEGGSEETESWEEGSDWTSWEPKTEVSADFFENLKKILDQRAKSPTGSCVVAHDCGVLMNQYLASATKDPAYKSAVTNVGLSVLSNTTSMLSGFRSAINPAAVTENLRRKEIIRLIKVCYFSSLYGRRPRSTNLTYKTVLEKISKHMTVLKRHPISEEEKEMLYSCLQRRAWQTLTAEKIVNILILRPSDHSLNSLNKSQLIAICKRISQLMKVDHRTSTTPRRKKKVKKEVVELESLTEAEVDSLENLTEATDLVKMAQKCNRLDLWLETVQKLTDEKGEGELMLIEQIWNSWWKKNSTEKMTTMELKPLNEIAQLKKWSDKNNNRAEKVLKEVKMIKKQMNDTPHINYESNWKVSKQAYEKMSWRKASCLLSSLILRWSNSMIPRSIIKANTNHTVSIADDCCVELVRFMRERLYFIPDIVFDHLCFLVLSGVDFGVDGQTATLSTGSVKLEVRNRSSTASSIIPHIASFMAFQDYKISLSQCFRTVTNLRDSSFSKGMKDSGFPASSWSSSGSPRTKVSIGLVEFLVESDMADKVKAISLQVIAENFIRAGYNPKAGLAPKEQLGGPRELAIQDLETKIVNYIAARLAFSLNRRINSDELRESLSHPSAKTDAVEDAQRMMRDVKAYNEKLKTERQKRIDSALITKRTVTSNTGDLVEVVSIAVDANTLREEALAEKSLLEEEDVVCAVVGSCDHSKWAPNHNAATMFFCSLSKLGPHFGDLMTYMKIALIKSGSKMLEIPSHVQEVLLSEESLSLDQLKEKDDRVLHYLKTRLIKDKKPYIVKFCDFMQGIFHDISSLYAMSAQLWVSSMLNLYCRQRGFSLSTKITQGSDDELFSFRLSRTPLATINNEEMLHRLVVIERDLCTLTGMNKSEKSVYGDICFEYNSNFVIEEQSMMAAIKFVSSQFKQQPYFNLTEAFNGLMSTTQQAVYMGTPMINCILLSWAQNSQNLHSARMLFKNSEFQMLYLIKSVVRIRRQKETLSLSDGSTQRKESRSEPVVIQIPTLMELSYDRLRGCSVFKDSMDVLKHQEMEATAEEGTKNLISRLIKRHKFQMIPQVGRNRLCNHQLCSVPSLGGLCMPKLSTILSRNSMEEEICMFNRYIRVAGECLKCCQGWDRRNVIFLYNPRLIELLSIDHDQNKVHDTSTIFKVSLRPPLSSNTRAALRLKHDLRQKIESTSLGSVARTGGEILRKLILSRMEPTTTLVDSIRFEQIFSSESIMHSLAETTTIQVRSYFRSAYLGLSVELPQDLTVKDPGEADENIRGVKRHSLRTLIRRMMNHKDTDGSRARKNAMLDRVDQLTDYFRENKPTIKSSLSELEQKHPLEGELPRVERSCMKTIVLKPRGGDIKNSIWCLLALKFLGSEISGVLPSDIDKQAISTDLEIMNLKCSEELTELHMLENTESSRGRIEEILSSLFEKLNVHKIIRLKLSGMGSRDMDAEEFLITQLERNTVGGKRFVFELMPMLETEENSIVRYRDILAVISLIQNFCKDEDMDKLKAIALDAKFSGSEGKTSTIRGTLKKLIMSDATRLLNSKDHIALIGSYFKDSFSWNILRESLRTNLPTRIVKKVGQHVYLFKSDSSGNTVESWRVGNKFFHISNTPNIQFLRGHFLYLNSQVSKLASSYVNISSEIFEKILTRDDIPKDSSLVNLYETVLTDVETSTVTVVSSDLVSLYFAKGQYFPDHTNFYSFIHISRKIYPASIMQEDSKIDEFVIISSKTSLEVRSKEVLREANKVEREIKLRDALAGAELVADLTSQLKVKASEEVELLKTRLEQLNKTALVSDRYLMINLPMSVSSNSIRTFFHCLEEVEKQKERDSAIRRKEVEGSSLRSGFEDLKGVDLLHAIARDLQIPVDQLQSNPEESIIPEPSLLSTTSTNWVEPDIRSLEETRKLVEDLRSIKHQLESYNHQQKLLAERFISDFLRDRFLNDPTIDENELYSLLDTSDIGSSWYLSGGTSFEDQKIDYNDWRRFFLNKSLTRRSGHNISLRMIEFNFLFPNMCSEFRLILSYYFGNIGNSDTACLLKLLEFSNDHTMIKEPTEEDSIPKLLTKNKEGLNLKFKFTKEDFDGIYRPNRLTQMTSLIACVMRLKPVVNCLLGEKVSEPVIDKRRTVCYLKISLNTESQEEVDAEWEALTKIARAELKEGDEVEEEGDDTEELIFPEKTGEGEKTESKTLEELIDATNTSLRVIDVHLRMYNKASFTFRDSFISSLGVFEGMSQDAEWARVKGDVLEMSGQETPVEDITNEDLFTDPSVGYVCRVQYNAKQFPKVLPIICNLFSSLL